MRTVAQVAADQEADTGRAEDDGEEEEPKRPATELEEQSKPPGPRPNASSTLLRLVDGLDLQREVVHRDHPHT